MFEFKKVTAGKPGYPPLLAKSKFAVPEIWIAGEDIFADEFVLAMVGTRTPSNLAADSVNAMVRSISQNSVRIVSGLAQGVDSLCHSSSIACGLKTTAIIGQGLDMPLHGSQKILADRILESGGSIISPFPLGAPAANWTFVNRNKIISGMSNAVILVESRLKGGAMHTVKFCLKENKKLYAVPCNPLYEVSQGGNQMIYEGKAVPVWNFADLPNILGLGGLFAKEERRSGCGKLPSWALPNSILTIDEVCERSKKSRSEVLSILTEMELQELCSVQKGQIVVFAGN